MSRDAFAETIAGGDLRQQLEATRDLLAAELEQGAACKECGGALSSPTASLTKQLVDVLARLDALPAEEGSRVDDIARKRAERLSDSRLPERPGVQRDGSRRGNRARGSGRAGS